MFFQLIFATTTFYIYISIFKNIFETVGSIVEEGFIRHMMMIILRCLRWDSFPCSRRVCFQTCFTHSTLCTQRIREKCHYLVEEPPKKITFYKVQTDRIGSVPTYLLQLTMGFYISCRLIASIDLKSVKLLLQDSNFRFQKLTYIFRTQFHKKGFFWRLPFILTIIRRIRPSFTVSTCHS